MNDAGPFLVANLKANKNWQELSQYLEKIATVVENFPPTVIVCPSSPFLASSYEKIRILKSNIKIGSQDISKFQEGPHTGEISASQIKEICSYAIVGHSERKKYSNETPSDVVSKVKSLLKSNIIPILCIADEKELAIYSQDKDILAGKQKIIFVNEPPGAISNQSEYKPKSSKEAQKDAFKIKDAFGSESIVIYGGSVNSENSADILSQDSINGALIGQASLSAEHFINIIQAS